MFLTGWLHQTCHIPISSWICLIANTVRINRKDLGFQEWHGVHTDLIQCFKGNSLDQRGIFPTKMSNYFTEIKPPIHLCKPAPAKHALLIFPAGKKMREARLKHKSNTERSTNRNKTLHHCKCKCHCCSISMTVAHWKTKMFSLFPQALN